VIDVAAAVFASTETGGIEMNIELKQTIRELEHKLETLKDYL